jgi:hypothetical protein
LSFVGSERYPELSVKTIAGHVIVVLHDRLGVTRLEIVYGG